MISQILSRGQGSCRPVLRCPAPSVAGTFARQSLQTQRRRPVATCTAPGGDAEVKIAIEGMMCDGCSSRIENVLKGMDSVVKSVSVSLEGKVATVRLAKGAEGSAEATAAASSLVETINGMGFEAKLSQ